MVSPWFSHRRRAADDAGALAHEVVGAEAHGAQVAVVRVPLDAGHLVGMGPNLRRIWDHLNVNVYV